MLIARELRKTNIVEYLLYMWQVEDLIRAAHFDADALTAAAAPAGTDAATMAEIRKWYGELIDMMTQEQVRESGHLQINRNILILLSDIHTANMKDEERQDYRDVYYRALPVIVSYRAKSDDLSRNEIESCMEFMYGIWMLRLQKRAISEGTADAAGRISALLAHLAADYAKERNGLK